MGTTSIVTSSVEWTPWTELSSWTSERLRDVDAAFRCHLGTNHVNMTFMMNHPPSKNTCPTCGKPWRACSEQLPEIALPHMWAWASNAVFLRRCGLRGRTSHLWEPEPEWGHMCSGAPPCPACCFHPLKEFWQDSVEFFYNRVLRAPKTRGCHKEKWWDIFGVSQIHDLPRADPPAMPDLGEKASQQIPILFTATCAFNTCPGQLRTHHIQATSQGPGGKHICTSAEQLQEPPPSVQQNALPLRSHGRVYPAGRKGSSPCTGPPHPSPRVLLGVGISCAAQIR